MHGLNINEKLEHLAVKYGIDRYHPRFYTKIEAEKLIKKLLMEYEGQKWILVAKCKTDIDYFTSCVPILKKYRVIYFQNIMEEAIENEEHILIVSYYGRNKIKNDLINKEIKCLCLYEYFEWNGLVLTGNYYDVFGSQYHNVDSGKESFDYNNVDYNEIFFYDRRGYENAELSVQKEAYLAKLIFDSMYFKDFELLKYYISQYITDRYNGWEKYEAFNNEIDLLLNFVKEEIQKRDKKDVIVFWLDALEYGGDVDMPFLKSISEKGIVFESAYTVTPYTHSTAKTMFGKSYVVDDKGYRIRINRESCEVISKLEDERGYQFRFYTSLNQVDDKIKGRNYQRVSDPLSLICWNYLCDLIESKNSSFSVLHEVLQTHYPYTSLGLIGKEYVNKTTYGISLEEQNIIVQQQLPSREYTDHVLKFYSEILGQNIVKIYMSDHGESFLYRYHTILKIVYKNIKSQKIDKLFSYINFGSLIDHLLNDNYDFSDLLSEYVRIQDVDYYYKDHLKYRLSQNKVSLQGLFGYQGLISKEAVYIRYNDNKEVYYLNKSKTGKLTSECIDNLKSLCPLYPSYIIADDKFKYSRNVYKTLEKYMNRNRAFEEEKVRWVQIIFDRIPDDQILAVRGGGWHTFSLWMSLSWEARKKIRYVIDQNPDCVASRLGLNIISYSEAKDKEINMIIVSSFDYERDWAEEISKDFPFSKCIKLYDSLKSNGVECTEEFYHRECLEQDVVWED